MTKSKEKKAPSVFPSHDRMWLLLSNNSQPFIISCFCFLENTLGAFFSFVFVMLYTPIVYIYNNESLSNPMTISSE